MQKIIRITKEKILKLYCIKKEMLRFNCYGLTPREQRPQYKKPTQTNRSDTLSPIAGCFPTYPPLIQ